MKRFERGKNSRLGSVRGKCRDGVTQILASLFSIFRLICVGPARLLLLLHTLTTRSPSTATANKHSSSPCHTTSSYSLSSLWWHLPLETPFFIYQSPRVVSFAALARCRRRGAPQYHPLASHTHTPSSSPIFNPLYPYQQS